MMSKMDELTWLDATDQARLVSRREVKPVEIVEAAIERIQHLNPAINAVVTPMYEEALAAASGELPSGPFSGVPFLLKDLQASYAGVRMTSGSGFTGNFISDHDSELVIRFKRAGLVILGKTNAPEFGLMVTTEPRLFGPSHNPWSTDRTTGGSSGGSGAAVASGMVPMAHGGDGGGSIRIPASCCGLFGLKPTRGRNPLGPDYGDVISGLVVEHALTRSVRDSAALLDATAGPDSGDPYWAPPPARPYLQEVGAAPGRLRIAFTTQAITDTAVHPDCVEAAKDAARLCAELGHAVEEASPSVSAEDLLLALGTLWGAGCAWAIDQAALQTGQEPTPDRFEPATWLMYDLGRQQSASAYLGAVTTAQSIGRELASFLTEYDVWLTPTLGEPPVPLGTFHQPPDDPMVGLLRAGGFSAFTTLCNVTGQPAMSMPLSWNADGLPIGTQFVGRFGDEATLFRLAAQLEEARPWADRRPPTLAQDHQ